MKFFVKSTDDNLIATIDWDEEYAKLKMDGQTIVGPFGSLTTMVLNKYPNAELVAEEDVDLSKEEVINQSKAWAKMQEDQCQAYVNDHHGEVIRLCEGHILPEDKELIKKLAMLQVISNGLEYINNKET